MCKDLCKKTKAGFTVEPLLRFKETNLLTHLDTYIALPSTSYG